MKVFPLVVIGVVIAGCIWNSNRHRGEDISGDQTAQISRRVADVSESVWSRLTADVSKLTSESGPEALESAKDGLQQAESKLQPGKRLDEAKAQIERLRAALDVQKIKHEMDEKVAAAQQLAAYAGKTADEVRAKLEAANKAYQELNDKLSDAQKTYDAAAKKVDKIKESLP